MLVVLEGIDGSGKTTLIRELEKKLKGVTFTKEPGSPLVPINQTLRKMILDYRGLKAFDRELLFAADASCHAKAVGPLSQSGLVISDRGLWSHLAYLYANMKMKMMDYEEYLICKKLIERVCLKPKAIIYLKGDLALMEERIPKGRDAIEENPPEFFGHVLTAYQDQLGYQRIPHVIELDGRSLVTENCTASLKFLAKIGAFN